MRFKDSADEGSAETFGLNSLERFIEKQCEVTLHDQDWVSASEVRPAAPLRWLVASALGAVPNEI